MSRFSDVVKKQISKLTNLELLNSLKVGTLNDNQTVIANNSIELRASDYKAVINQIDDDGFLKIKMIDRNSGDVLSEMIISNGDKISFGANDRIVNIIDGNVELIAENSSKLLLSKNTDNGSTIYSVDDNGDILGFINLMDDGTIDFTSMNSNIKLNAGGGHIESSTPILQQGLNTMLNISSDLSEDGYQIMGDGLYLQWGRLAKDDEDCDFPISFPNACFAVVLASEYSNADNTKNLDEDSVDTDGFDLETDYDMVTHWFAIGN